MLISKKKSFLKKRVVVVIVMRLGFINWSCRVHVLLCINMSAKRLLEMTQLWYQCNEKLERTQAILQKKEQLIDIMKEELESLRVDNDQLWYVMSYYVHPVERILIENNKVIPLKVWLALIVSGFLDMLKTGTLGKSRQICCSCHGYEIKMDSSVFYKHHGSVTV